MLSHEDAAALVLASRLFDEHWYAALVGEHFATRAEAVARWVADPADDAPHPLFEPVWLYPGGRWRRHAPDPLSYYLAHPGARARSPHPLYTLGELGPLEDWLAEHDPAELLGDPVSPDASEAVGGVCVLVGDRDLSLAVRWLRHLSRLDVDVVVRATSRGHRRVLAAVAAGSAGSSRLRLSDPRSPGDVVVTVDEGVEPPAWPWLAPLLTALDRPGVAAAQPLLLADDLTLNAPALLGHPVSAVERLDGIELPDRFPGVEARRTGDDGVRVLATGSWLLGPPHEVAALTRPATSVRVVEGHPRLQWAIDIAAGAAPIGRRWGDWHFARSLADALERQGQWVEIDHPETRGRATRAATDVVLTLRGLERVAPQPGAVNLLWVISHPDDVTTDELAAYDVVYAAGTAWAERHGVLPLLQCTDTTRFHPGVGEPAADGEALFVGNARGGPRPVVTAALAAGVPLRVVGAGWAEHGVEAAADRIANADLPGAYASASVVLNDHHDDMRVEGFVSNRVFDVLAVGGRLLSDDVAGLSEVLDVDLPVWRTPADLARLARAPYDTFPDAAARLALAERVVAEHSFDARASTLLDAALTVRS